MKNFIYTTLFVFATLFCQAFGSQNEWPQLLDTTICVKPGTTVHLSDFKPRILELLQNREDSIWSECCDKVTVNLGDISGMVIKGDGGVEKNFSTWTDVNINTKKNVYVDVVYTRELVCTKIPSEKKANMVPASLAMWHLFGKLLSETETGKVTKISDEATVTTLHKAKFVFLFELTLPEDPLSQIIEEGGGCFEENDPMVLSVGGKYTSYRIRWTIPKGIKNYLADTVSPILIQDKSNDYLYSIVCTAIACKGETRSDTIFIGRPTPIPEVDDLGCIAANKTSFNVAVKEPDSRFSYHWTVEDLEDNRTIDTQQGASVIMAVPQKEAVRLKLRSSGGCKDAEMESMILHRSLVSEAHHIEMESEPLCIFEGDTLRFSLPEAPDDTLVWQIADNKKMLTPYDIYNYQTLQAQDNVIVSVYAKFCPDNKIMDTFNIREDFKVLIEPNESCISAHTDYVFKVAGNGINPEVHWYGNGIELDTTTYSPKDSILLRLTNPGDQNLYVAVKAKECGRERDTLLVLRPKPEKPLWDSLMGMFPPCIPLGIEDMIELWVQPQEGVKFKWSIPDIITNPDSNSILVKVNYDLTDRNMPIPVSVYAYTDGCPNNSDILQDTLYATGAGLDEEWNVIQQIDIDEEFDEIWGYIIGFSDDDLFVKDYGIIDPFEGKYLFDWYVEDSKLGNNAGCSYYFMLDEVDESFDIFCKLTSKESQCYSVYSTIVGDVDIFKLQSVVPESRPDAKTGERNGSETTSEEWLQEKEEIPCPDIVLHPNPVHSGVQVKVEGICETESFTVECYSSQGRLMFRTTAKGDTFTLPTDNYAAGVYIVKIQLDGAAAPVVRKMIII